MNAVKRDALNCSRQSRQTSELSSSAGKREALFSDGLFSSVPFSLGVHHA